MGRQTIQTGPQLLWTDTPTEFELGDTANIQRRRENREREEAEKQQREEREREEAREEETPQEETSQTEGG